MEIKDERDEGITSFCRICNLVAPIERKSRILFLFVERKAESICMVDTMIPTKTVIKIIALLPVPNQMMIRGPSAILGRAFSTTMYGSKTLHSVSLHQRASAMTTPNPTAIKNPISVSAKVTPIW